MSSSSSNNVVATSRFLRISPSKLSLVANKVAKMSISDALAYLKFCPRAKAGKFVVDCLCSAIANGENNFGFSRDGMRILHISVGLARSRKKLVPRARGRGASIIVRWSSLRVVLSVA